MGTAGVSATTTSQASSFHLFYNKFKLHVLTCLQLIGGRVDGSCCGYDFLFADGYTK